jgi:hypothetical protein
MTTGDRTFKGLAVPLFGESTITQQVAGTDVLTVKSIADSTAANMFAARITASSAVTAGYTQGFYVNMNLAGGMTGGSQIQANCFAADVTLTGTNTSWITGTYVYICGSPESSSAILSGHCSWFAALSDDCLIRAGFHAGSEETAAVTVVTDHDAAFLAECAVVGAWNSLLEAYGGPPYTFLTVSEVDAGEEMMYSSGAMGNVATAAAWLRVDIAGTNMWIALHASCTST